MSQTGQTQKPEMPFEEAMTQLETIVEAMESSDLPLETLLSKYEQGTRLARACHTKLAEAELKMQQLEQTADGEMTLRSVHPLDTNKSDE